MFKRRKTKEFVIYRRGDYFVTYDEKNKTYWVHGRGVGRVAEFDTDASATAYCKSLWIDSCNLDDGR